MGMSIKYKGILSGFGDRNHMDIDEFICSGFVNMQAYEQMYEQYQSDPTSVDSSWRECFTQLENTTTAAPIETVKSVQVAAPSVAAGTAGDIRIYHLIHAYRTHGHLLANVNPLKSEANTETHQLNLETLGFHPDELGMEFPTGGVMDVPTAPLKGIIATLKEIYCGKIGVEYMGLNGPEMEWWLQQQIEPTKFKVNLSIDEKQMILQHLNKSELFEIFLHTKYVGQKRFSLEGAETLIPIIAAFIEHGANLGLEQFIIGMAHRGRLNVLSNILDKSYSDIFSEFEESYIPDSFEGSGDVKYHKGFSSEKLTSNGTRIQIELAPNPSHLEAVNPVVEGEVKARQVRIGMDGENRVVPILIHGDAAISGQGVVYETMQFCKLPGYTTGGTVHIVINNQIGFTTVPEDCRSTLYCTDIAKTFGAPVFHVNAEDPEACIYAIHLATEIRQRFHHDVFIDLMCYRKYGHNEGDEPAFTQPLKYQDIKKKKPIREIYRDDLIKQGVLEKYIAEQLEVEFKKSLNEALKGSKLLIQKKHQTPEEQRKPPQSMELFDGVETAVPIEQLKATAQRFCAVPNDLTIHRKLQNLLKNRLEMAKGDKPVDWGMGEMLAYATLLWDGVNIRIAGQDCCRGTFSHRHALWVGQKSEQRYYPLKNLKSGQGRFDIYNSPLSEFASLGFEYGYSMLSPDGLVIWEAQFGDFCNGAQTIIDQFISTSEQKWARKCRLVMLLPHGYEGQGPEHSSARIERFLTLAGDQNMFIVNPTTPAQLFHLLRRQILMKAQKPLIVFTPKGLLRYPVCVNDIADLSKGTFNEILDDPNPPSKISRLAVCSGRIYYDLIAEREKRKCNNLAIIRIEQLYPLHIERLKEVMGKYTNINEVLWVQEEPSNMGAWVFIRPKLQRLIPKDADFKYIGRARSASPAVGSFALHKREHAAILDAVFPIEDEPHIDVSQLQRV